MATRRPFTEKSYLSGTLNKKGEFTQKVNTKTDAWRSGERNTVYFADGEQYTGEWAGDLREGEGVNVWPCGDVYEGEWELDMRHGLGKFSRMRNGQLLVEYHGSWKSDVKHGQGKFYYDNGDVYEGEWQRDNCNGWGMKVYADGACYDGEWLDGERSGQGTHTYANGDVYKGSWLHDMKDGKGRLYYMTSRQVYEGEWLANSAKCGVMADLADRKDAVAIPRVAMTHTNIEKVLHGQREEIALLRAQLNAKREEDAEGVRAEKREAHRAVRHEDNRIGGKNKQRSTKIPNWQKYGV